MKLRGILVGRVSTKPQAQEDRFSREAQFRFMRECCERRGIQIVEERWEPGRSAFTPDLRTLPILYQTVLDIEAGKANALVMHESSRLARNEQLANYLLDRLTACGAAFINSMIDIDYTSPEGRVFFNNEASMNAYSSRKTSQHARKGKLEQFLQGLQVGQIPFGYIAQPGSDGTPNRKLPAVIVPEEAALIVRAYEDHALGRSPDDIAREWNRLGFVPRSVKGIDRFQGMSVRSILETPYYRGAVVHHGEEMPGQHQPIVTEEQWWAAQRPRKPILRAKLPPLLLQGIVSCARCGHRLYPLRPKRRLKDGSGGRYAYYVEPSDDFNLDCPDGGLLFPSAEPDQHVDALIRSMATSKPWLDFVIDQAARLPADVEERRGHLQEGLRRAQKEYLRTNLPESEYLALRRELESELALLPTMRPELVNAARQMEGFGDLWDNASAATRNETCRLIFESIVLDVRERALVEIRPYPEFEPLFRLRRDVYVRGALPGRGSR